MKNFLKLCLIICSGLLAFAAVKLVFEIYGPSMKKYYTVRED